MISGLLPQCFSVNDVITKLMKLLTYFLVLGINFELMLEAYPVHCPSVRLICFHELSFWTAFKDTNSHLKDVRQTSAWIQH